MNRYLAAPYLDDLSDFQRRTVNHVFHQLYGPTQAKRFLVADETGLGKTRVARGLIARAIEHLQDDESVQRIDVVYVCSNSDLAQQNITRLNVTGEEAIPFASRLTMLGSETQRLTRRKGRTTAKPVNLVSFTPGTSFEHGRSLGQSKERAMLLIAITAIHPLGGYETTAAHRLLQGQVRTVERFRQTVGELRYQMGDVGIDPPILRAFRRSIKLGGRSSLLNRFLELVDEMGRKRSVPDDLYGRNVEVVREMRAALARASVETLEPDLVILDEFQRFRHLLDPDTPAGELPTTCSSSRRRRSSCCLQRPTSPSPMPRRPARTTRPTCSTLSGSSPRAVTTSTWTRSGRSCANTATSSRGAMTGNRSSPGFVPTCSRS